MGQLGLAGPLPGTRPTVSFDPKLRLVIGAARAYDLRGRGLGNIMNDKTDLSRGRGVEALVAIFAILTFSVDAHAQDGWQRGSAAGKQPNASTAGDFPVVQLATTEPDKLMADWNKSTPGVSMVTNTQASRNQPIVTFIIFKGCRADAAGNCNVTVDYDTAGP
jgi:hypothetical protein